MEKKDHIRPKIATLTIERRKRPKRGKRGNLGSKTKNI